MVFDKYSKRRNLLFCVLLALHKKVIEKFFWKNYRPHLTPVSTVVKIKFCQIFHSIKTKTILIYSFVWFSTDHNSKPIHTDLTYFDRTKFQLTNIKTFY
jgi:hypothetical protein